MCEAQKIITQKKISHRLSPLPLSNSLIVTLLVFPSYDPMQDIHLITLDPKKPNQSFRQRKISTSLGGGGIKFLPVN